MKIRINNGLVKIETRKRFNKGIENISKEDTKNIMKLFGKIKGARIDIDIIDIDLFDEMKAFEYDENRNPIIHNGSFCDYNILYYSIKEFVKRGKNSNVTDIYFGIDNEKIKGEIEILNNTYKCYGIFPEEINTDSISEEIDFEYEF